MDREVHSSHETSHVQIQFLCAALLFYGILHSSDTKMSHSHSAQLAFVGILGFVGGYVLHWYFSPKPYLRRRPAPRKAESDDSTESGSESEYESEDEIDIDSTALNDIPGPMRMTLVVRQDLKMGKGKAAAQCSHATLALYKKMADASSAAYNPELLERWEKGNGQAKVTLQVPNQEEMDLLFATAMSLGVNAYIVHDAGRTQVAAGSATVLGLGPAPTVVMDEITGGLKLY